MLLLLWLVRIYKWLLIVWVLLTWVPGVAGSTFHNVIGIPIVPVLSVFSFLQIGFLGLQAIIPLLLLNWAEVALQRKLGMTEEQLDAAASGEAGPAPAVAEAQPRD